MGDRRRRQSQRRGRGLVPQEGRADWKQGLPLLRLQHERINGDRSSTSRRTCLPAAFSTSSPAPTTRCRFVLADPDGVDGNVEQIVTVRTRARAEARSPEARVYHVYPPGYTGTEAGAGVHRPAGRVLHRFVQRCRQPQYLPAAGAARRHDPGPCRPLQGRSLPVWRRRRPGWLGTISERHLFPDAERHTPRGRSSSKRPATAR